MVKKRNFGSRKTELEWQKSIDKFYLTYIPKWFEFLNWIILLGIFNFLSSLTKDWRLNLIYIVSNLSLFFYLQSYFYNIHIEGLPFIQKAKSKRIISVIISGLISLGTYYFIASIIPKISGKV